MWHAVSCCMYLIYQLKTATDTSQLSPQYLGTEIQNEEEHILEIDAADTDGSGRHPWECQGY